MTYTLQDFIGNVGVFLILFAYLGLQTEKLRAKSFVFNTLNLSGALLILFSLLFKFNLSAFIIELAWAVISLYGLWQTFNKPQPQ